MSEDPSGFHGREYNLFAYTGNNPLSFNDPSGLWRNPKAVYDEADKAANQAAADPNGQITGAKNDAYKHCLASCLMTMENMKPTARFFGWVNEVVGDGAGQLSGDRYMDYYNNAKGRHFGMTAKCVESVSSGTKWDTIDRNLAQGDTYLGLAHTPGNRPQ